METTYLSSHALAKLLLSKPDGEVYVLEEITSGYSTYTKTIQIPVNTIHLYDDGTVYATGLEIDKDGDVTLGEK